MEFGELKSVDLRLAWENEAINFTTWLSKDENLKKLGSRIGIELEPHSTEERIGPFRADVVCKDTASGDYVLIENQLEKTDHTHLGQILTYTAGLDAVTIVWIAKRFTDEHLAALEWLNEVTKPEINFFGIEVELLQVDNSRPAVNFKIVCRPNDWTKSTEIARRDLTDTQKFHLEFFGQLRERILDRETDLQPQAPQPQCWTNFGIGRTNFSMAATTNIQQHWAKVELNIYGDERLAFFKLLRANKDIIHKELGFELEWEAREDFKTSTLRVFLRNVDIKDKSLWPKIHGWMIECLEAFRRVFYDRIVNLDASNYESTSNNE
jgi:hypothetical protein